jgi:hypothetical protein
MVVLILKNLTTIDNKFINYIIIFLISCSIIIFFISQIKIEKSINGLMSVDEDKGITIILDSADAYFIRDRKDINFILNNKLYIVRDITLTPLPDNKFSITVNDQNLETLLQQNTILKVNINLGFQKLYELLFQD